MYGEFSHQKIPFHVLFRQLRSNIKPTYYFCCYSGTVCSINFQIVHNNLALCINIIFCVYLSEYLRAANKGVTLIDQNVGGKCINTIICRECLKVSIKYRENCACVRACVRVRVCVRVCVCVPLHACTHVHVRTYVIIHMCARMHASVHVFL